MLLDEVTQMSKGIQAKLLRVLQDGRVRQLGGEAEETVDVRIIAATNLDPREAVRDGMLREDLFFRLWVVPIFLPALRERRDDIPGLARHFLQHYWTRHRAATAPPVFSVAAVDDLTARPWAGNVRELQNTMEHLSVTMEPAQTIDADDIPTTEDGASAIPIADGAAGIQFSPPTSGFNSAKEQVVTAFERAYLKALVERADNNLLHAARLAKINRATLYRLLEKHDLTQRPGDGLDR